MTVPATLAAFTAGLALLFGGAALAGEAIDPDRSGADTTATHQDEGGHAAERGTTVETATQNEHLSAEPQPVRGLAVADDGLRVVVDDPELRRGRPETVRFRIVDERGATVRDFDVEHEKRMHLIIARRDLSTFQHLHPEQGDDGAWTTEVELDKAGSHRLFADFSHEDQARTLATDLRVDGDADLRALPRPVTAATSDGGYDVDLEANRARAGEEAELRFTVKQDGRTIHTEPYLGAGGHLVALREGDLAFLHVHPTESRDDEGGDAHDDSVGFATAFPTEGRYRLFLQFQHQGRVQTVAFTQEVSR